MKYIISDINNSIIYIPIAVAVGIVMIFISILYNYKKHKKYRIKHAIMLGLLSMQLVMMLEIALLSRESGTKTGIDLAIGSTWGKTLRSKMYVLENIIFFIPYGLFLPATFSQLRKWYRVLGISFLTSFSIELLQLITRLGYCQTDDMITNTIGGMIGYAIFYIYQKSRY